MNAKLAPEGGAHRSPYVSNLGGSAGERILPPPPACPTPSSSALPEEMEAARRVAELFLANSTEMIACHDPAGRVLWASERAREVMGRSVGNLLGRPIDELVAPEDRPAFRIAYGQLLSGAAATATCVYRVRLRNGRRRWVESRFRAIRDGRGELREVQSSTRTPPPAPAGDAPTTIADQSGVERLRELTAHLETAREEERTAMARDLHDDLGHQLTALGLDLDGLAQDLDRAHPDLAERTRAMQILCGEIMASMHRIVTELRPAVLDGFGLAAAIEWQAGEFARRTGIATRVELVEHHLALEPRCASAVFRIVQEALTNVARHAGASSVVVTLRHRSGRLELEVEDDGRGFEPIAVGPASFGLLGMRERAMALGGALEIESSPGSGTHVRLRVPL